MKTTVILYRNEDGTWTLSRYKGDIVPSTTHQTATAARTYAKKHSMRVKRAANCDD